MTEMDAAACRWTSGFPIGGHPVEGYRLIAGFPAIVDSTGLRPPRIPARNSGPLSPVLADRIPDRGIEQILDVVASDHVQLLSLSQSIIMLAIPIPPST